MRTSLWTSGEKTNVRYTLLIYLKNLPSSCNAREDASSLIGLITQVFSKEEQEASRLSFYQVYICIYMEYDYLWSCIHFVSSFFLLSIVAYRISCLIKSHKGHLFCCITAIRILYLPFFFFFASLQYLLTKATMHVHGISPVFTSNFLFRDGKVPFIRRKGGERRSEEERREKTSSFLLFTV